LERLVLFVEGGDLLLEAGNRFANVAMDAERFHPQEEGGDRHEEDAQHEHHLGPVPGLDAHDDRDQTDQDHQEDGDLENQGHGASVPTRQAIGCSQRLPARRTAPLRAANPEGWGKCAALMVSSLLGSVKFLRGCDLRRGRWQLFWAE
jgi:hypothetical protein